MCGPKKRRMTCNRLPSFLLAVVLLVITIDYTVNSQDAPTDERGCFEIKCSNEKSEKLSFMDSSSENNPLEVVVYRPRNAWHRFFDSDGIVEHDCPHLESKVRFRRSDEIADSDDVIIYSGGSITIPDLRGIYQKRKNHQFWMVYQAESAITHCHLVPPKEHKDFFHAIATFHSAADLLLPYGAYLAKKNVDLSADEKQNIDYHGRKHRLIAWMSSHLQFKSLLWERKGFVDDLSKYLPVDVYGLVGNLSCPRENCSQIITQYKFFLALENSCCNEYITEKFWESLGKYEVLPVVVGAPKEDYERLGPPNSFIHADDFDSMEELADYIMKVSEDKDLYNSYFAWKREGVAIYSPKDLLLRHPMKSKEACHLLSFLKTKRNSYRENKKFEISNFSFHNETWLDSCINFKCGKHGWIQEYFQNEQDVQRILKIRGCNTD